MKSIGIVRKVDELGRIVIPKELRNSFEIEEGTSLEIFTRNNEIILKKYSRKKCDCGQVVDSEDKYCRNCGEEL